MITHTHVALSRGPSASREREKLFHKNGHAVLLFRCLML